MKPNTHSISIAAVDIKSGAETTLCVKASGFFLARYRIMQSLPQLVMTDRILEINQKLVELIDSHNHANRRHITDRIACNGYRLTLEIQTTNPGQSHD